MNTKKIPMILMLVAGAAVSIVTYIMNYELKDALVILLSVLIVFYILGMIVKKIFDSFQIVSLSEAKQAGDEEGEVIEKEPDENTDAQDAEAQNENSSI